MKEKEHIRRSHNCTMLLYHIVLPAKYRKHIFSEGVFKTMIEVCKKIEESYEIGFLEIGNDEDHIHFMIQGLPMMTITRIVTIIKSITAKEILKEHEKEIKRKIYGGKIRTNGYYANTVGAFAGEQTIRNYIQNQGISKYKVQFQKQLDLGMVSLFGFDI